MWINLLKILKKAFEWTLTHWLLEVTRENADALLRQHGDDDYDAAFHAKVNLFPEILTSWERHPQYQDEVYSLGFQWTATSSTKVNISYFVFLKQRDLMSILCNANYYMSVISVPKMHTTYNESIEFENVHFAHWTSTMFKQPRVHTSFMELMPIKRSPC